MSQVGSYVGLYESGELKSRLTSAWQILEECQLCPHSCGVNRLKGELGKCNTGRKLMISSYSPHFGEESPLVGINGSGTIFFTNCNLKCVFCQNYPISQIGEGREANKEELTEIMLSLQRMGCHNINLVSPTHIVPQFLEALELAIADGLTIPLVYNCGGYESVNTLKLLEGIVDIYMPDMKYSDAENAYKYSGIKNYPAINKEAIMEMYHQVGDLQLDEHGIAISGLLVRHLVLPNGVAGSEGILRFIADKVSKNTYVNIMAQYRPSYKASQYPLLSRRLSRQEFIDSIEIAHAYGLERLDKVVAPSTMRILFGK
jgi:putative pyruvate formate lyase activating enzyme